jgi:hypothetical protein
MTASRFLTCAGPVLILALGGLNLASAQSASPFAKKKDKRQAWETAPAPAPAPVLPQSSAPYSPPVQNQYVPPAQARPAPTPTPAPSYGYTPPAAAPVQNLGQTYPTQQVAPQTAPNAYYSAPAAQEPSYQPPAQTYPQQPNYAQHPNYGQSQSPFAPQNTYRPGPQAYGAQQAGYGAPQQAAPRRSLGEKLGLGRIKTLFSGRARAGAAFSYRDTPPNQPTGFVGPADGESEDFVADGEVELEVGTITDGGLEYGVHLQARAQYDPYRRGFGGRISDCPPTVAGCASSTNGGVASGLRGHTSQFYQFGRNTAKDQQIALDSAHLFLRSAYGDVTLGRDDGAAYLFSLGAPTLLAVNASNSPVDYTGLDSVKTVNDASGFAEKITYTSPRLLGDTVGIGVQIGASYAPDADACGVDYCNDRNIAGNIRPELEDVLEAGLALDRKFDNGLSVEGTLTYARASESSGLAGLDDLSAYGAGLEFGYGDLTLGGSWLQSNNALIDGDYTAYDVGITWKPSALGFSLAYGHAEDDNVGLTSDQGTFGVTYEFDKFTLGTGIQYVDRTTNAALEGLLFAPIEETGTSIFVEGGFKF